ncbi:Fatty acid oxidation complex subunit alpha [Streptomyces antimycoticus]
MASSASDTIAVVGAGVMGRNITALALGRGVDVVLVDVSGDVLESARAEIAQLLRHGQFMGAFPASQATGTLTTTLSSGDVADAEVVIEAITEDAALKARVMAELSGTVPAGVPLITNTSGIPIAELAKSVQRPAELAGVHFMNPSYLIEMVEVVRGPQTGEDAMAAILSLLERLGRKTVVVRDAPGFVTSRLLHPMINEAARIVAEGTASVEDVDQLMAASVIPIRCGRSPPSSTSRSARSPSSTTSRRSGPRSSSICRRSAAMTPSGSPSSRPAGVQPGDGDRGRAPPCGRCPRPDSSGRRPRPGSWGRAWTSRARGN